MHSQRAHAATDAHWAPAAAADWELSADDVPASAVAAAGACSVAAECAAVVAPWGGASQAPAAAARDDRSADSLSHRDDCVTAT